ncbi:flagellar biosynthesis protein FlgL [Nitrobacter sp.]|uniref:flagellar biosynthesis protein FlgL n=1 Tax=Nitrobacter sp. TaxID=29420 RepID=UPI001E0F266F|nr:flagellar biosynthesis protein FlgL [Nitrobacter sp.]MCB1392024.1 flagellar biosynthesis protein FlgL [Nitrobacter sp.]
MAVNGIGFGNTILGGSIRNLKAQMADLQGQLTSGKRATTYSGMGANEGFAIAARAQLSNIAAYTDTMMKINTNIGVANTALQVLSDIGTQLQNAAISGSQTLNSMGQTAGQQTAVAEFSSMVGILNTQAGDRYIFSGSTIYTQPVASSDLILNGNGAGQAGLRQVISERKQADLGAGGLGRIDISSPTVTSVAVAEDASPSVYGLKLQSVSSSLLGATVTGPTGAPPVISVDLGVTNPVDGDTVSFTFDLPDGTSETVQLTASSEVPAPAGSFAIGATPTATAANLNAALTSSIGKLANTSLVAASAIRAARDFFDQPPQRVDLTPPATLATATAAVNGTVADTVQWYTGDDGAGSARATSVVRVDSSVTVQYGMRASEDAIRSLMESVAVLAAVTTSPTDPNAADQISALNSRVAQNLTVAPGSQTIGDIQVDLANAQTVMKDATARQKLTQATMQNIIDQAENVSTDEVASQLLALQTDLQASYQTTAMLSQLSLVKFL